MSSIAKFAFCCRLLTMLLALAWVNSTLAEASDSSSSTASSPIGKVIFVMGENSLVRQQQTLAIERGMLVFKGDSLSSGEQGHVHLLMSDQGFLSLRPNSLLTLEEYHYNSNLAADNRVKIRLDQGVLRSVTGKAGSLNKAGFRLNTPVAAIGVRGTDFTVQAASDFSRLSVRSGGVVMASFGADCSSSGSGPCSGSNTAELFASDSGAVLESRLGQPQTIIMHNTRSPDEISPPQPEEQQLLDRLSLQLTVLNPNGNNTDNSILNEKTAQNQHDNIDFDAHKTIINDYISSQPLLQLATDVALQDSNDIIPNNRNLSAQPAITWGRWSDYSGSDGAHKTISQLMYSNRRYAAINDVFGLLETRADDRPIPRNGRTFFKLNSHETYIKHNSTLEAADLSNASLVIDFDDARFATHMKLHANSLAESVTIVGSGNLNNEGFFSSDSNSPAQINGVFSPQATEAGFLFDMPLAPNVSAIGATHWVNTQ